MKRRVEVLGSTAMSGRTLAATLVATGAIVLASGGAAQARTVGCRPPRGPGDSQVHSADVQAHNITCATARRIMLKCAGFSYGHSGMCRVAGRRWWCFSASGVGLESAEACIASPAYPRSVVWIWLD